MAEAVFSAVAESLEGMATRCTSRGMSFVLDEPPSLGGKDEGMNPLEAVLSALGACKCVVARAFAKPNGIRLRHVRVEVWTAIGFVDGSEKLELWFRLPSWVSPSPDGLRSGYGTRARNEAWSDCNRVQSMMSPL